MQSKLNKISLKSFFLWDFIFRYYFAFILAEAVNNAGGLGFNGLNEKGQPKWDLLTNIKPFELEKATSLKVVLDYWNMRMYKSIEFVSGLFSRIKSRNGFMASSYLL